MNVPPPTFRTSVLTSLPRALPPPVAAASLAATLRHARRRRIRRRAGQTVGTVGAAALVYVLALWGTNDFPADAGAVGGSWPVAGSSSKQGLKDGQGQTATIAYAPASALEQTSAAPPAASVPILAASGETRAFSAPPADSNTIPPPAAAVPKTPPASFVLVRSQPVQTVRTTPLPEQSAATDKRSSSFTMVATAAVPAPMVITTRRAVAPQSIATADHDSTPEPATDADLFAHADGRPAALCRLNSGGTRWFWLDEAAVR
jgi:hypothetical protein